MLPYLEKLIHCQETFSYWFYAIEEKGKFGRLLAPGRKIKYWEMERDDKEKSLVTLQKLNEQKDKAISKMEQQLKDYELQKLDLIDSEEKLAKLYHMGIIDSNGEYLGGIQNDPDNMS